MSVSGLIDFVFCPIVLILLIWIWKNLEERGWWTGSMTTGSLLYAMCHVRMMWSYLKFGYILFVWGWLQTPALDRQPTLRMVLAIPVTYVWFQYGLWNVMGSAYYFCSGCLP